MVLVRERRGHQRIVSFAYLCAFCLRERANMTTGGYMRCIAVAAVTLGSLACVLLRGRVRQGNRMECMCRQHSSATRLRQREAHSWWGATSGSAPTRHRTTSPSNEWMSEGSPAVGEMPNPESHGQSTGTGACFQIRRASSVHGGWEPSTFAIRNLASNSTSGCHACHCSTLMLTIRYDQVPLS